MTTFPVTPRPILDEEAIWTHLHTALNSRRTLDIWTAVADVPVLLAEIERLRRLLAWTRTDHANLLAATQATLAAHADGENAPLYYVRDAIAARRPTTLPSHAQGGDHDLFVVVWVFFVVGVCGVGGLGGGVGREVEKK